MQALTCEHTVIGLHFPDKTELGLGTHTLETNLRDIEHRLVLITEPQSLTRCL